MGRKKRRLSSFTRKLRKNGGRSVHRTTGSVGIERRVFQESVLAKLRTLTRSHRFSPSLFCPLASPGERKNCGKYRRKKKKRTFLLHRSVDLVSLAFFRAPCITFTPLFPFFFDFEPFFFFHAAGGEVKGRRPWTAAARQQPSAQNLSPTDGRPPATLSPSALRQRTLTCS